MTTTFDIPKTSQAAVLTKHSEPLEIREIPVPQTLEPGALLVRIEAATVCGSDLHLWDGSLGGSQALDLPVIPGHEMVGRVIAFGDGAERDTFGTPLEIGDRICFTHASCNQCDHCRFDNQPTLCTNRQYYMFTNCERPRTWSAASPSTPTSSPIRDECACRTRWKPLGHRRPAAHCAQLCTLSNASAR